jgi:hypothetical protein
MPGVNENRLPGVNENRLPGVNENRLPGTVAACHSCLRVDVPRRAGNEGSVFVARRFPSRPLRRRRVRKAPATPPGATDVRVRCEHQFVQLQLHSSNWSSWWIEVIHLIVKGPKLGGGLVSTLESLASEPLYVLVAELHRDAKVIRRTTLVTRVVAREGVLIIEDHSPLTAKPPICRSALFALADRRGRAPVASTRRSTVRAGLAGARARHSDRALPVRSVPQKVALVALALTVLLVSCRNEGGRAMKEDRGTSISVGAGATYHSVAMA